MKKNIIGLVISIAIIIGGVYSNHTYGEGVTRMSEISSQEKIDGMHDFLEAIELELESEEPENVEIATRILDELYTFFTDELPGTALCQLLEAGS